MLYTESVDTKININTLCGQHAELLALNGTNNYHYSLKLNQPFLLIWHRLARKRVQMLVYILPGRSQWPRGLRRRSVAARLLGL